MGDTNTDQTRRSTAVLIWFAAIYMIAATAFLLVYLWRFHEAPISDSPADWAGFAQMIGALFGVPLAIGSVALVLRTVQLQQDQIAIQQDQHSQLLERENTMLDPVIQHAARPDSSFWTDRDDAWVFRLTVAGTARWSHSACPGRDSSAIITTPTGEIDVIMWPVAEGDGRYRAFLNYQRTNGSTGWYWVMAIPSEESQSDQYAVATKSARGPTEDEDGITVQVLDE